MICPGDTKKSGAKRSVPALSRTLTVEPARLVGNGVVVALAFAVARFWPKALAIASLVNSVPRKLAAETAASAALPPVTVAVKV